MVIVAVRRGKQTSMFSFKRSYQAKAFAKQARAGGWSAIIGKQKKR